MLLDLLSDKQREPAECLIKVGLAAQEIADLYPYLVEVTVDVNRGEAAVASLRFDSRRDENGVWAVQDSGRLETWEPILIEAAFGNRTEEVLRGYIREVNADYPQERASAAVKVECQDRSLALDRGHRRQVWGGNDAPTSDATILTTVLGRHGLTAHGDSGAGLDNLELNQDGTDIRFLRQRAAANGYELLFQTGNGVYFGPLRLDAEPQDTILVYAGPDTNCISFAVKSDGHQPEAVAFDMASTSGARSEDQVITPDLSLLGTESAAGSATGLDEFVWRMEGRGGSNSEELRARAQRLANEQSLRVKAEGELDGSLYGHVLRVGEPVGVDGVGERLQGIYYVDRVRHRFSMEGYRQQFTLLRNAYGDNLSSGANPLAAVLG